MTNILTDAAFGTSRRSLIKGIGAALVLLAAPPIVRASSLMDIRGVPLRAPAFIPCDGRVLSEVDEPELFAALAKQARDRFRREVGTFSGQPIGEIYAPHHANAGRQYGGEAEAKTFAVPDFTDHRVGFDFDLGAAGRVNYDLDRAGELYVSVEPVSALGLGRVRQELGRTFSPEEVTALLKGERLKL